MKKIPEIALVHWMDSASYPYWNDESEEYPFMWAYSVGFVIKQTKDKIVLSQSASMTKDAKPWADVIVIPRVCVRSIKRLRTATEIP